MVFFTSAELATSVWVVIAPMVMPSPSTLMPFSSAMALRSTMSDGSARRWRRVGSKVWPPAMNLPSEAAPIALAASATEVGRWNAKLCMMASPLFRRFFRGLDGLPHFVRRGRHGDVLDTQRHQGIEHAFDPRGGRADRPDLADTLHAQRIVGAERHMVGDFDVREV